MKVKIYRPSKSDRETLESRFPESFQYLWEQNMIIIEVPDLEGYDNYDPFLQKYYFTTQEDNFRTWVDDETGKIVQQQATMVRLIKHFDDGTVSVGEWKSNGR